MSLPRLWYIPGWAADRKGSCPLVSTLRPMFEVEVIWLPDYGNPNAVALPQSIYADAVAERLRRETSPVTLVGWSLGGMVALELAAMVPSAVNGLVLLSTTAKFCRDKNRPFGPHPDRVAQMRDDLSPETLRRFFINCYHPCRPQASEVEAKVRGSMDATEDQLRLGLTYLIHADLRPLLPELRVPTLVIHGGDDAVAPVQATGELARTLRTNSQAILAGFGHMLPDTCPVEIRDLMVARAAPNRAN